MNNASELKKYMLTGFYDALGDIDSISDTDEQKATFEYLLDSLIDNYGTPPKLHGGCECGCLQMYWSFDNRLIDITVFSSGDYFVGVYFEDESLVSSDYKFDSEMSKFDSQLIKALVWSNDD